MRLFIKSKTTVKKVLTACLVLLIVTTQFAFVFQANAKNAEISSRQKRYEIAVVYDNSGSMYKNKNKAWSRAKYAIEIFASMLDYSAGDKLTVFPMAAVTTDGSTPPKEDVPDEVKPIEIRSQEDVDKISRMFTINPADTPLEPIEEAGEYLDEVDEDGLEKWLIVLTDGAFNEYERGKLDQKLVNDVKNAELRKRLKDIADEGINVQYLGIGNSAPKLPGNEGYLSDKAGDTELRSKLVGICNTIFQRIALPSSYLNGTSLDLKMSMRKLVVFVQGDNAQVKSLVDENGKEIPITQNSNQRKWNTVSGNKYLDAEPDKTLAGQVVTFDACPKGKYTLNYSDAKEIQVFYDPDIDIAIHMLDEAGEEIDTSKDITAGDYILNYALVDSITGEDVSGSELLGNDVSLEASVKQSEADRITVKSGDKISLEPDDETYIVVEGTYLDGYYISSEGTDSIHLPIKVVAPEINHLSVEAKVLQKDSWYLISKRDEWQPIRVDVKYDDAPLSDEALSAVDFSVAFKDELPFTIKMLEGESAYEITICKDEEGNFTEPEKGLYSMTAKASVADEYNKVSSASDKVSFSIQPFSKWVIPLIIIAILAVLIALFLSFMNMKVLPKKVVLQPGTAHFVLDMTGEELEISPTVGYTRRGHKGALNIKTPNTVGYNERADATFSLRAVDKRWTKSKDRHICITGISSNSCWLVAPNQTPYVKDETGSWVRQGMAAARVNHTIEQSCKNAQFKLRGGTSEAPVSTLTVTVRHK